MAENTGEKKEEQKSNAAENIVPPVTQTPEQIAAAQAADLVAGKISKDAADTTIVLVCRKHANGTLSWSVPTNLETASFMLKVLDVAVSQMLKMALQPRPPKVLTPGGNKIIIPGIKH